jgi:hypothetical protein
MLFVEFDIILYFYLLMFHKFLEPDSALHCMLILMFVIGKFLRFH